MDTDQVKKALDCFVDDNYVEAKETLIQQIRNARDKFLKDKLGLPDEIREPEDPTDE